MAKPWAQFIFLFRFRPEAKKDIKLSSGFAHFHQFLRHNYFQDIIKIGGSQKSRNLGFLISLHKKGWQNMYMFWRFWAGPNQYAARVADPDKASADGGTAPNASLNR